MKYVGDGNQVVNWHWKINFTSEYKNHMLTHMFDRTGLLTGTAQIVDERISVDPELCAIIIPIGKEETTTKLDTMEGYRVYWPFIFEDNFIIWLNSYFQDYHNYFEANVPQSEFTSFVDGDRQHKDYIMTFPTVWDQMLTETTPPFNTLNPGRPDETRTRIVARYIWQEFEDHYVDFLAILPENTLENDVIIVDYETFVDYAALPGDPDNAPVTIVPGSLTYENQVKPQLNLGLFAHRQSSTGECNIVQDTSADTLNGLLAGNTLDLPISNGTLNVGLDADLLGGFHVGNENDKISVANGTMNDNLVTELVGSLTQAPLPAGNETQNIPISNSVLCKTLNCQYFNGKELWELFYDTHTHTLDNGEHNSVLDDVGYPVAATWSDSVAYPVNFEVVSTVQNGNIKYVCITAGTSDVTEPIWDDTIGNLTFDNDVVWVCTSWGITGSHNIFKKIIGIDSEGFATTLSIEEDAFKYRHQSTTDIDEAFYLTSDVIAKKLFIHHNREQNDYRFDDGVFTGDIIEIPTPNIINSDPVIMGRASNTAGFGFNSGNQVIYNINIDGGSGTSTFQSYGIQTTSNNDTNGVILTTQSSDTADINWIAIGEREDG